jgi:hypothetical protein
MDEHLAWVASIQRKFQLIKTIDKPVKTLNLVLSRVVIYFLAVNDALLYTTASARIPVERITAQRFYFGFLLLKACECLKVICVYENSRRMSPCDGKPNVVIRSIDGNSIPVLAQGLSCHHLGVISVFTMFYKGRPETYNRRRYLTCYGKTQKAEFGTIYIDRDGEPDSYTEGVVIGNGMITLSSEMGTATYDFTVPQSGIYDVSVRI